MLGLIVRVALILFATPIIVNEWYMPFLNASTSHITFDPWSDWIKGGGAPIAFPYGYTMWLVFIPLTLLLKTIGLPLQYSYVLTLLFSDLALLLLLYLMLPGRDRLLLLCYWLSPIVILASYGLGYNDLVPILLVVLSLFFMQRQRLTLAGVTCAAAVSAKLSMVLVLPFFLVYLINNRSLRQRLSKFLVGLLAGGLALWLPFLFSNSGLHMLFSNPEMGKVYLLALNLGNNIHIYVVPLLYFVMLYMFWRVGRLNYDLLHVTLGIVFLLIVLMTPASPG